jgi:GlpG protein
MRQIATLPNESDALRFAAFLVARGVAAHAEEEDSIWAIWVRDEDHVDKARDEFERFRENPTDSAYEGAERAAREILLEEHAKRRQARKNVVEMRSKWNRGGTAVAAQRIPFTRTLIFLSVTATILGSFQLMGESPDSIATTVHRQLGFCDRDAYKASERDAWVNIRQGQIWRLITPVFVHADPLGGGFGILHVLFNMFWVYRFGGQIELLRGSTRLAGLCLAIAVFSNILQATLPAELGGSPFFVGMSGVLYGLFGYVWMKSWYDHGSGFFIDQTTVLILMVWLFICMTPMIQGVANAAHIGGLVAGVLLAFIPIFVKSITGK